MNADVASAIQLGEKHWVYASHQVHFWDLGMPTPACGLLVLESRAVDAIDFLNANVVADGRVVTQRRISEVVDFDKIICSTCAGLWRDE